MKKQSKEGHEDVRSVYCVRGTESNTPRAWWGGASREEQPTRKADVHAETGLGHHEDAGNFQIDASSDLEIGLGNQEELESGFKRKLSLKFVDQQLGEDTDIQGDGTDRGKGRMKTRSWVLQLFDLRSREP